MKKLLIVSSAACVLLAAAAPLGGAANRSAAPSTAKRAAGRIHQPVATPAAPPVYFEGKQIDIAHGAGASLDCVIYLTHGACFRTVAEMKADEARVAASPTADGAAFPSGGGLLASRGLLRPLASPLTATLLSCSAPLSVWTDEAYNGTEKDFAARQIWRNMTDYGINDQISSFIVGQCSAHLAENTNGGGLWYPCDTSAGAHHREMDLDNNNGGPPCSAQSTNWNDRVSSTWLN
jgi:hypothetical protein